MKAFLRDVRGATAIEYGLIAALIVIAAVASIQALGSGSTGSLVSTTNIVTNAMH